VLDSKKHNYI